jgi:hypothetical protein
LKIIRIIALLAMFALLGMACAPADAGYTQDLNDSEVPGASDDGGQQADPGGENSGINEPSGGSPQTPVIIAGLAIEDTCTIIPNEPATAQVKLDGVPLAGATVLVDEVDVGLTDSDGNIAFVAPPFAVFEIKAVYGSLSRFIEIDTSEG